MKRKKLYTGIILTAAIGISLATVPTPDSIDDDLLTGKFTEAENNSEKDEVHVEQIYWDFGDGKTAKGKIAMHNYTEGTYNVTVTVVKSNGENETHRGQIEVGG